MSNLIQVKEGIEERRLPYFHLEMCRYGAKLVANGSLVPDLTFTGVAVLGINTKMHASMVLALDDHTQSAVAHGFEKELHACFKQNARDTEKQAIILNDLTLPAKVGHELIAERPPIVIPPIFFKNTNIIGIMDYRVKAHPNAYNYLFEINQINEDGSIFSTTERQLTNASGIMDGFVSGAKYLIRCQPIFLDNAKGEWTEYFDIRAN
jgi:hypothetical protein